ncbi:hypothetical protein POSPLADRAFT_1144208 [Postia placenta MAD-698-R-SB12]|uniref:DUF6533 domain-containing protein n=1 Tax=Postia placenta MAD-698-R-SB12 TaxID=670580 RepID=A0A1X6MZM7_9APHY|nr:hypothetical protein POSPLADRAFT_1144208 [Postia placenta MAD-698-R-SB12]OSX61821.1 hypothetical protein POSPLADRAFT_1144208 [Postia placenta MAD-698-R-SB12]
MSAAAIQSVENTYELLLYSDYHETTETYYLYDCIITFDREVEVIWTRKLTGASVLYILNRYLCAVNQVISILPSFVDISSDCMVCLAICVTRVTIYEQSAGFSGLRVYGVSGRRWKALPVVVVILGTVPLITNTNCPPLAFLRHFRGHGHTYLHTYSRNDFTSISVILSILHIVFWFTKTTPPSSTNLSQLDFCLTALWETWALRFDEEGHFRFHYRWQQAMTTRPSQVQRNHPAEALTTHRPKK